MVSTLTRNVFSSPQYRLAFLFPFLFATAFQVPAGERPEWPPKGLRDGSPPPGPLVEVSPRGGKQPYAAYLTGFKSGLITLVMLGGEVRQEVSSEVATLRFNPTEPPAPPPHDMRPPRRREDEGPPMFEDGPPPPRGPRPEDGGRPRLDNGEPPPPGKDGRPKPGEMLLKRLRALQDREQREELKPDEVDELRSMRETMQLFPGNVSGTWRVSTARQAARQASRAGKLDEHIASMQKKMWEGANFSEVRDALIMLGHGYLQRDGADYPTVIKKLQADIANIKNPNLRDEFQKHPPDFMEILREPKNDFAKKQ